jgi:nucleotide-binding universal stress UspA family protein
LDRAVDSVDDVRTTGRLVEGPVVDTLVDIDAARTDLLVCGSRDYGPVARVLLGGVSGRVVRHARVPVTVVPRAR